MRLLFIILVWGIFHFGGFSQTDTVHNQQSNYDSVFSGFSGYVYLDSVVVSASRNGFDVADFIKMVKNDNTFYRAFKNLRFAEYDFSNKLSFFDKKKRKKAGYTSLNHQFFKDDCRWMEVKHIDENKNFIKSNNKYRYYTAKLYDRLFYTHGKICNQDTSRLLDLRENNLSGMEKYVVELKKMIFSPGRKANVPFIGSKMEIFSKKMSKYYNFSITQEYYGNTPCYVFTAYLKPGLSVSQADNTVVKFLKTFFARKSLQIIRREYHLKYKTPAYNFDVKMAIVLQKIQDKYFPSHIKYNGTWHVLFKKRETCKFETEIKNLIF